MKVLVGILVMGLIAVASLAATAGGSTKAKTISVAIVANPQMQDIASLTPSLFTAKTGIKVKYTILDEGKLREVTTRDVGSGGKSFDAVMIGMYEAPQFGTAGLLQDLTPKAKADKVVQLQRPDSRRCATASRRTGSSTPRRSTRESSFVMYRKDVLAKAGLKMPATSDVGSGRRRSPARSTRRRWPASACAASPAGATSVPRSPPC